MEEMITLSELAENIFIFLDSSTIIECRLVNKTFKEIIDNPHFYLRKLAFDGQKKHVQKIFDAFVAVRDVIKSFVRGEKESDQLNTRFYKNIWSTKKDVQFFGYWNQRTYECNWNNWSAEDDYKYFTGLLTNFLSKWKQVFNNLGAINYEFDKNPILYLIKMSTVVSELKKIPEIEKDEIYENFYAVMKKRGNWNDQSICQTRLELPITVYRLWSKFYAYTLKYLPTLNCFHCTQLFQENCQECYKIYNITAPLGEEDTYKFEQFNHIQDLCFGHRKKLIGDCFDSIMVKLLGNKACGAWVFLAPEDYGFVCTPTASQ